MARHQLLYGVFLTMACAMLVLVAGMAGSHAYAQSAATTTPSNCLAIANTIPGARFVSLRHIQADAGEVSIHYIGHSTFWIASPGGVTIATDYAGWSGSMGTPQVVTMNKAHETHYTSNPDPAIAHVLRGWGEDGNKANHNVAIGDVLIRNVTTDIRSWPTREKDANSIFIFEIAGLCIGHLGHLHHELGAGHVGWIGRLDVVMVPVDGSWTLPIADMANVIKTLRARVVLPMHAFGEFSLSEFVGHLAGQGFAVRNTGENSIKLSLNTLPDAPTIVVLRPGA